MPNIKITAKSEPYRRCGVSHTRAGIVHAADRFTDEQLEQLRADPHLVVSETDEAPTARVLVVDGQSLRDAAFTAFCREAERRAKESVEAGDGDWSAMSQAERQDCIDAVYAEFVQVVAEAEADRSGEKPDAAAEAATKPAAKTKAKAK